MRLLQEGQWIRGTYQVERFLGEGAFAEVYRVKHRFLGRQAMKVFKAPGMTPEETMEQLGEAVLLSQIGHHNIVRVYDADILESNGKHYGYFTMENVAAGSLVDFWKSHGSRYVPIDSVLDVMCQVCRGLSVAHAAKIIHRDIKPQNILVGYDSSGLRARVADFGLARRVNRLSMLATTKGTIDFKAPEALRDLHADSQAGDVWALGTTLYMLLTDRLPYGSADGGMERFHLPPVPASQLNAQSDPRLDQLLLKALAVDPAARFPHADAMLTGLLAIKDHPAPVAQRDGSGLSCTEKSVFGIQSSPDELRARAMVRQAIDMAKSVAKLGEAADLLEEALNKWPMLRDEYASQLKLWRCGITSCRLL
jgi:serine/threonine-protein kinase